MEKFKLKIQSFNQLRNIAYANSLQHTCNFWAKLSESFKSEYWMEKNNKFQSFNILYNVAYEKTNTHENY